MTNQLAPLTIAISDDNAEYFDDSCWPSDSYKSPPHDYKMATMDTDAPIEVICIDVDQTIGDVSITSIFYRIMAP